MPERIRTHETVYVIVRVDSYFGPASAEPEEPLGPGIRFDKYDVTVKEVLTTHEEAILEVKRLNDLKKDSPLIQYYWTSSHYFPGGDSHGTKSRELRNAKQER